VKSIDMMAKPVHQPKGDVKVKVRLLAISGKPRGLHVNSLVVHIVVGWQVP